MSALATAERRASTRERLCATISTTAARLGIRDEPEGIANDLRELTEEALRLYDALPRWPSALTDSGVPVELSVRMAQSRQVALRCVFDVVDHRTTWAENWLRTLRYGALVAGAIGDATAADVWELCRSHLAGIPARIPSKVIHGIAYGADNLRRGSLYFRTGWMPPEVLVAEFRTQLEDVDRVEERHRCQVDPRVEVMGYDLVPGRPRRFKSYRWVALDAGSPCHELVGDHPDLEIATTLFEQFRGLVPTNERRHCLFLQTSTDGGRPRQRLFFFARAWGWTNSEGADRMLAALERDLGLDLDPLFLLASTARSNGMPLKPAMLAVGMEDEVPSATVYLWPVRQPRDEPTGRALVAVAPPADLALGLQELARTTSRAGRAWLLTAAAADGSWTDSVAGTRFTTGYVAAATSALSSHEDELPPAAAWLRAQFDSEEDEPQEAAAVVAVALARLGESPPADADVLLRADASDEAAAAGLLALVSAFQDRVVPVLGAVLDVLRRQDAGGGWASAGWSSDLYATWWALRALRAFETTYAASELSETSVGRAGIDAAARALARGRGWLGSIVVPAEPFLLGLWLGSWSSAHGDPGDAKVAGVLFALERLQNPDGHWLGGPNRLVATDRDAASGSHNHPLIDDGLVTTATVIEGLQAFLLDGRTG